ncbi:cytochrome c-type biogenesis CcmF C-terminal domain-containing protein [uncultured Methanomethylovorans sp.]|uniref:cytochrome c-type biogenesis CcmF C-terminal domain-containing protein n=1 Tax=uncultured Methanomethylovorans sp. TaxID=183759 RepID=UPI0026346DFB|nr:cytochrome c-type biogenesis CcmF C-terminal domain-containing protein [uncultured Methanomethylovorans sp.]
MTGKESLFTTKNTIFAAVIAFILLAMVVMTGMMTPLLARILSGTELSLGSDYFNPRTALPTVLLIMILTICLLVSSVRPRSSLMATAAFLLLVVSVVAISPFSNTAVDMAIALVIPALIATAYKIWLTVRDKKGYGRYRGLSAHLIHLGILCILLGVVLSSNMKIEDSAVFETGKMGVGNIQDYTLKITSMASRLEGEPYQEHQASSYITRIDFDIYDQNRYKRSGSVEYITDFKWGQTYTTTYIHRGLTEELFIVPRALDEETGEVDMYVRIVPFINLLWGGIYMMALGIIALLIVEHRNPRESIATVQSPGREKDLAFFEKRYEKIMEQELRKLRSGKNRGGST